MDLIARLCKLRAVVLSCFLACVVTAHGGWACAQGEVQRQHDADMRTFERGINTYHNNADDYPKPPQPKVSLDMSPNYVPILSPPPRAPEAYVESAEQKIYYCHAALQQW